MVKEEDKGEEGKGESQRLLVGVMRVGLLAKQLLLKVSNTYVNRCTYLS